MRLPLLTITLTALLLTACTSLELPTQSTYHYHKKNPAKRRLALKQIKSWQIDGAFSIHQPGQSDIAAYHWQQQGQRYFIRIHGALNTYSIAINGRPGQVTLEKSTSERYQAKNPDTLMQQQLGWRLPLSGLTDWLRGIAGPGHYRATYDNYGHLISLQQQGWHIRFSHYLPINQVDLPQMLQLQRGQLAVKIVIKRWQI